MSVSARLKELLDDSTIVYEQSPSPALSPAEGMVKTAIVNADGLFRIAVLPANLELDLHHLQFITRSENIRLANESELKAAFPDCDADAIPPFGTLFGLPVFCDSRLDYHTSIEFGAGTRGETIRMAFTDYKRLASPTMIDLVDHHKHVA